MNGPTGDDREISRSPSKVCVIESLATLRWTVPVSDTTILLMTPVALLSGIALGTSVAIYESSIWPALHWVASEHANVQSGSTQSMRPLPLLSTPSLHLVSCGPGAHMLGAPVQM